MRSPVRPVESRPTLIRGIHHCTQSLMERSDPFCWFIIIAAALYFGVRLLAAWHAGRF